ncbi:hypothetical protein LZP97_00010 [Rhodococcus sp. DMF-1]|uniref:hypothetical protein n=1 Tax=Rhodococcus sp. DMF-1 TaxID=2907624 RepID=UPI001F44F8AF|nr:hypothetical protein [Rhodococcus sp. DMF-1]UIR36996.1 hypothetical protein LZP97_00010 [Rhodococcus sp. DMF-1]
MVNVVRIYPTTGRGGGPLDETATSVPCGTVWAAILQIGIVRCTSVMDERGNVGDPADIQNEALVLLDDAARLGRIRTGGAGRRTGRWPQPARFQLA